MEKDLNHDLLPLDELSSMTSHDNLGGPQGWKHNSDKE